MEWRNLGGSVLLVLWNQANVWNLVKRGLFVLFVVGLGCRLWYLITYKTICDCWILAIIYYVKYDRIDAEAES